MGSQALVRLQVVPCHGSEPQAKYAAGPEEGRTLLSTMPGKITLASLG